ncbi:hypothetical protein BT69DRAFT_584054 [Atractiella rhizophila]|nr:hypothetical protein BT69DRAFT_659139 [Atractiella rhizophila]KAH8918419.1 hypothetical protein BT69DRAFT_584054 [Atractiella rhizophila]
MECAVARGRGGRRWRRRARGRSVAGAWEWRARDGVAVCALSELACCCSGRSESRGASEGRCGWLAMEKKEREPAYDIITLAPASFRQITKLPLIQIYYLAMSKPTSHLHYVKVQYPQITSKQ